MWEYKHDDYIQHHGILGMKWGVRRYQNSDGTRTAAGKRRFKATSFAARQAKRENERIDKSFREWKEGSAKRQAAIEIGKQANLSRRAKESNKGDKDLKLQAKTDQKAYKKALSENTTYRKGQVKQEVRSDLSRKYLSDAKKVQKQLQQDPGNRDLQKQYNKLMSKHATERAAARKERSRASARSRGEAVVKAKRTRAVNTLVATATVNAGVAAVGYISKKVNESRR